MILEYIKLTRNKITIWGIMNTLNMNLDQVLELEEQAIRQKLKRGSLRLFKLKKKVLELYGDGVICVEIAKKTKIPVNHVYDIVNKAGRPSKYYDNNSYEETITKLNYKLGKLYDNTNH